MIGTHCVTASYRRYVNLEDHDVCIHMHDDIIVINLQW